MFRVRIKQPVMRTRTVNYPEIPFTNSAKSLQYTKASTGEVTKRTSPVECYSHLPATREYFEAASDLDPSSKTFGRWNSFDHFKSHSRRLSIGQTVKSYKYLASSLYYDTFTINHPYWMWQSAPFGPTEAPTTGLPTVYSPQPNGDFVVIPVDGLENLKAKSLAEMLPSVKPELSLLNSVYELKDFKKLPDTLRRMWKLKSFISQIATNAGVVGRDAYSRWLGRKSLRRALNSTADGYLSHQFAIAPLLADIAGFQQALRSVDKQVKSLLQIEGKKMRRHFNASFPLGSAWAAKSEYGSAYIDSGTAFRSWCGLATAGGVNFTRPYSVSSSRMFRHVGTTTAQFHAECEFSYYLSRYQRERARVLVLLDSLGVNLNPSIIWNALPWTFVIDWVINIGQWLDQFKVQHMEPVTIVHRYLYSVSIKREVVAGVTLNFNSPYFGPSDHPMVLHTESGYARRVCAPPLAAACSITGFSLKEFLLSGALLLSKRTR